MQKKEARSRSGLLFHWSISCWGELLIHRTRVATSVIRLSRRPQGPQPTYPWSSRLSRRAVGPQWSMGLRPTQGDENGFCSATALHGSAALPFVIPTARCNNWRLTLESTPECMLQEVGVSQ
jgi:hypothetical protein